MRLTFAVAETANALVHALVQQSSARGQKLLGSHFDTYLDCTMFRQYDGS